MSVNSTDAFSGPYTATGASQIFPFTFTAASRAEVQLTSNGIDVDPTSYSVTLNSDGTGAINATLPAGAEVFVESNPDFQQSAQFARFAPYFPDAINVHLDRAAIRDIALQDRVSRTFVIPRRFQDAAGKFPSIGDDGNWQLVDGVPGLAGAAANTRNSLAELKAANIADKTSLYDGSTWFWTLGNYSATLPADLDVNIVKANSTALTVGAWVRQRATGVLTQIGAGAPNRNVQDVLRGRAVNVRDEGAVLDGVTDDSAAFARALSRGRAVLVPGRMYLGQNITIPDRPRVSGFGSQVSTIVMGPGVLLTMEGPGFSNLSEVSSLQAYGRGHFNDIGFASADNIVDLPAPNFRLWKVQQITFTNCLFYHVWINLDNHRYVTFRSCEFFGFGGGSEKSIISQCTFQPAGNQFINEILVVDCCHSSSFPWLMVDTVEPRFNNSSFFAGAYGIRSRRQYATGDDNPFYMGVVAIGNTFDSIRGPGVDCDYAGTNSRLIGNFFSAGRELGLMGARFTNSYGVEIVGNHFEWCGNTGLRTANCANFTIIGNTYLNMAAGAGINATTCGGFLVIGNSFENRPLFGGSGNGATTLAIETPANDLNNSTVIGNRVAGMTNPLMIYAEGTGNRIFANPGAPITSERNWAPARSTGWTASTGIALRGAYATYAGGAAAYSATQDAALRDASQRIKALEDALRANGIIDG